MFIEGLHTNMVLMTRGLFKSMYSKQTKHCFLVLRGWIPLGVLSSLILLGGCHSVKRVDPVIVFNTELGPATIAVAPAMNLSGSSDFDPNRIADLMASELNYAEGIKVIPVSRVLTVLGAQGQTRVESPAHALELIKLLGADAILVFAVTEYDPYDPPTMGISAQLFGARSQMRYGALDPIALSRQAGLVSSGPTKRGKIRGLLAQTQRVFSASHGSVVEDIKRFAAYRGADDSPYGWRRFVVNQQDYVRYCCHATIRSLLSGSYESVGPETMMEYEVRHNE